ncbi:1-deoxy-D-xylulose-5-phosphate synthase [Loktanella sp. 3ANDIMAR09]|uniref:RC-LH1 core complex protein PufX n=1 Tax=Loktanella sp. 3ANDIMAR09 TaxID=1225657 RepID=UPI0006F8DC8A|nr:RC-LH1 core complex protein PufX [Loktanella sp. 3ANDIMAR09]KQI69851.1 1-deoxy-D-xylulose-5-phosphate synthase [Loktanella sp. 3ANDIMAR09]
MSSDETSTNLLGVSNKSRLAGDVLMLMLKGAGYAAIVVLSIWAVIAIIALIGRALPEESRQQPDPTPLSWDMSITDLKQV